jgi:CRISPR-associated protein Csm3
MENPIIRHPLNDEPYIPGSSIKGKVRSLLEYQYQRRDNQGQTKGENGRDNGEPCECGRCMICRVFGPHKNTKHNQGPTRVLFRDAALTKESKKELLEAQPSKGIFFAEVKTENLVNRNTGTAEHPRTQERVPAGMRFDFEISIRIFDDDRETEIMDLLKQGLTMLQADYLGGSGSRGYGKISLDYKISEAKIEKQAG